MADDTAVIEQPQVGPQVAGAEGIDPALIARLTPEPPAEKAEPAKPQTAEESVRAAMKAVAERTRNPDGTFAPKTNTKPAEAPAQAAATAGEQNSQQPDKPTPPPVIELPAAAKGLLKATDWAKLPAAVRDALAKDLAALDGYVPEKVKGDVDFGRAMRSRAAQYEQEWRAVGVNSPEQAVDALFKLHELARSNLPAYLSALSRMTGQQIVIAGAPQGASAGQQPAPQYAPNPLLQQVLPKVQYLEQNLQRILDTQTDAQINNFRLMKDAQGALAYPHFDAVAPRMGQLLQAGMAKDMADAYEQAVWADATLRNRVLEDRAKADQAKRADEQRRAVAEAQRAASPPKGAPGAPPVANANAAKRGEHVADSVRNAIRRIQANA